MAREWQRQEKKASLRLPFITLLFYAPPGPPKLAEKSGGSHMYTLEPPILYPEAALRGACSGQHPIHFRFSSTLSRRGAVRFLLWWLFLHRRLRSRQRGSFLSVRATLAPFRMISPCGPARFYPAGSRCLSAPLRPSLSASVPGVQDSGFPLLLSPNGVSPPPFHLPVPVKMPVSDLDYDYILHPENSKSSRIYFNYCPYFTGTLWKICGYLRLMPVDKNVEKPASYLRALVVECMANLRQTKTGLFRRRVGRKIICTF